MGKKFEQTFHQKTNKGGNKDMKRLLVWSLEKCKLKPRDTSTHVLKWQKILKIMTVPIIVKDIQQQTFHTPSVKYKMVQPVWKTAWQF